LELRGRANSTMGKLPSVEPGRVYRPRLSFPLTGVSTVGATPLARRSRPASSSSFVGRRQTAYGVFLVVAGGGGGFVRIPVTSLPPRGI
jgi:hypothetical protein